MGTRIQLLWWSELFPYFYDKALSKLNILTRPNYAGIPVQQSERRTKINNFVQKLLPLLKDTKNYFSKLHLALFYFGGHYFEWSKRMAGVKYASDRVPMLMRVQYHILGLLIFIQLFISTYSYCKSLITFQRATPIKNEWIEEAYPVDNSVEPEEPNCVLCLEARKYPTVAACGHIFCWNCIHDSVQTKPECPLCRQSITPQSLTRIYHYVA